MEMQPGWKWRTTTSRTMTGDSRCKWCISSASVSFFLFFFWYILSYFIIIGSRHPTTTSTTPWQQQQGLRCNNASRVISMFLFSFLFIHSFLFYHYRFNLPRDIWPPLPPPLPPSAIAMGLETWQCVLSHWYFFFFDKLFLFYCCRFNLPLCCIRLPTVTTTKTTGVRDVVSPASGMIFFSYIYFTMLMGI